MTTEEQLIIQFLQQSPDNGYGRMEIARKAVRRKEFDENPRWADAPLNALMDRKVIVLDTSGAFRLNTGGPQALSRQSLEGRVPPRPKWNSTHAYAHAP